MNRIQLLEEQQRSTAKKIKPQRPRSQAAKALSSKPEHGFFVPMHYEPNYAYPLIVWLHGSNSKQNELKQVMPHISLRNYVGVAPEAPATTTISNQNAGSDEQHLWRQETSSIYSAVDTVVSAIEAAEQRFHIAPQRIFVAGYGSGGTMALRLAMTNPDLFAGAASLEGPFPQGHHPMANLVKARKMPLLIGYGRDSTVYPESLVCDELPLFHAAGMSVNFRQYPCGHELTTQMLSDLNVWAMEIVTGQKHSKSQNANPYRLDELN